MKHSCPQMFCIVVAKSLLQNWKKLAPENSSVLIKRKDKQSTVTIIYKNQQLEESNTRTRENIERQPSQSTSSSYTTSQTHDEVKLISRGLIVGDFSISCLTIFKELKDNYAKYPSHIRSVASNLKDLKRHNLRKNFYLDTITSKPSAVLTAEICLIRFLFIQKFSLASEKEMAIDTLKEERTKLHESAINEHQPATGEGTHTDNIQCEKCQQKSFTYTITQPRTTNESMTLLFLCKNCGNRWKM